MLKQLCESHFCRDALYLGRDFSAPCVEENLASSLGVTKSAKICDNRSTLGLLQCGILQILA
jgi:hypothetical protein